MDARPPTRSLDKTVLDEAGAGGRGTAAAASTLPPVRSLCSSGRLPTDSGGKALGAKDTKLALFTVLLPSDSWPNVNLL